MNAYVLICILKLVRNYLKSSSFILFYFILFYFILFYFILFEVTLSFFSYSFSSILHIISPHSSTYFTSVTHDFSNFFTFSDGDTSASEMDMKINHKKNDKKNENFNEKNYDIRQYKNERKECFSEVAKHLNTVNDLISNNDNSYNNYTPSKSLFTSSAQDIMFRRMHHISNKPTSTPTSKNNNLKSENKSESENDIERNSTTK